MGTRSSSLSSGAAFAACRGRQCGAGAPCIAGACRTSDVGGEGRGSDLYLLGTIHITKPGMNWRSDKIEAAFEASDEYWMEATTNGDMAMMEGLIVKHGYDRERPLSSKLKGDDWARVQSAARTVGAPISTVERMRPWLAALALGVRPATKDEGYDFTHGVDRSLEASKRVPHERP